MFAVSKKLMPASRACLMSGRLASSPSNETYAPVTATVGLLLDACERAGQVRPGLDPADVLLLMGFLWRVGPDEAGHRQAEPVLEIVIDGIRADG
jgi:hypothetical protein